MSAAVTVTITGLRNAKRAALKALDDNLTTGIGYTAGQAIS